MKVVIVEDINSEHRYNLLADKIGEEDGVEYVDFNTVGFAPGQDDAKQIADTLLVELNRGVAPGRRTVVVVDLARLGPRYVGKGRDQYLFGKYLLIALADAMGVSVGGLINHESLLFVFLTGFPASLIGDSDILTTQVSAEVQLGEFLQVGEDGLCIKLPEAMSVMVFDKAGDLSVLRKAIRLWLGL